MTLCLLTVENGIKLPITLLYLRHLAKKFYYMKIYFFLSVPFFLNFLFANKNKMSLAVLIK